VVVQAEKDSVSLNITFARPDTEDPLESLLIIYNRSDHSVTRHPDQSATNVFDEDLKDFQPSQLKPVQGQWIWQQYQDQVREEVTQEESEVAETSARTLEAVWSVIPSSLRVVISSQLEKIGLQALASYREFDLDDSPNIIRYIAHHPLLAAAISETLEDPSIPKTLDSDFLKLEIQLEDDSINEKAFDLFKDNLKEVVEAALSGKQHEALLNLDYPYQLDREELTKILRQIATFDDREEGQNKLWFMLAPWVLGP